MFGENTISEEEQAERRKYYPLWLHMGEVFLEPLVLAFFILIVFTRIQHLVETSPNLSVFWQQLNDDMWNNQLIYFGFVTVFLVWVVFKSVKTLREYKIRKRGRKTYELDD